MFLRVPTWAGTQYLCHSVPEVLLTLVAWHHLCAGTLPAWLWLPWGTGECSLWVLGSVGEGIEEDAAGEAWGQIQPVTEPICLSCYTMARAFLLRPVPAPNFPYPGASPNPWKSRPGSCPQELCSLGTAHTGEVLEPGWRAELLRMGWGGGTGGL